MPVGFLSDEQASRYGQFLGDPSHDQLARHFHLDDADRAFVGEHRGDHNRLGVAAQLGSIRVLGTFLEDPGLTPKSVVRFAGDQLAMAGSAELMATYVASAGRWRHGPRIRERYGYRLLTDFGVTFRLRRFCTRFAGPAPTGLRLSSNGRSPGFRLPKSSSPGSRCSNARSRE
jgi:hypothetical protein